MTISLADLKSFDDAKILEFVKTTHVEDETIYSAWNETPHPETLFYDFYDEVMVDVYTKEQKAALLQGFKDENLIEEEHLHLTDLDEVLEKYIFLKEYCGEDSIEIIPEMRDQFDLYMFKWLLSNTGWGDEFLVAFANGSLEF